MTPKEKLSIVIKGYYSAESNKETNFVEDMGVLGMWVTLSAECGFATTAECRRVSMELVNKLKPKNK